MGDKTSEFLWNASRIIPINCSSLPALRCHYLSKCKHFETQKEVALPAKLFNENSMCKFCFNVWSDGKFNLKVLPKKVAGKRMLKTLHKSQLSSDLITDLEQSLLARHQYNNGNKLVMLCLVCHKKTVLQMSNPTKQNEDMEQKDVQNVSSKKKKKRKSKNKYAGLKPSAFVSKDSTPVSVKHFLNKPTYPNTSTPIRKMKMKRKSVLSGKTKGKGVVKSNTPSPVVTPFSNRFKKNKTLQKMLTSSESYSYTGSKSSLKDFFSSLD